MNDNLNNKNVFDQVLNTSDNKSENEKDNKEKKIVNNFPDWDLLPPFQTVRRITRK